MRIARTIVDVILILLWIGTICEVVKPRDYNLTILPPPFGPATPDIPWAIGEAFAVLELITFILSTVLVVVQYGKASGAAGGDDVSMNHV